MTRAQSTTEQATRSIAQRAGVAQGAVNSFYKVAGGSSFRPYGLIAVSRAFDSTADRANLLRGTLLATTAIFGGFTSVLTSNIVLRYADTFTSLNNQVRVVADSVSDASARFSNLEKVAERSRAGLGSTATLYSRIQKAAPERSSLEILNYVETIQKALQLGGATAQEAQSAAIQFSQAIASNRLGGEELRAILETPLGLELARGMDVTIGKFREMGKDGELTADKVLGSLGKIKGSIDQQFARSTLTLDQALTIIDNKLTAYVGRVNDAYGVTRLLGQGLLGIGNNLETVVPVIGTVAAAFAAMFAARNKALLTGLGGATAGALLGNELAGTTGALIGGIAGGLAGFRAPDAFKEWRKGADEAKAKAAEVGDQLGKLRGQLVDIEMQRSNLARAALGDTTAFAGKAEVNAYARASSEVTKLDQQQLALRERLRQATSDLGATAAQVSPRVAKLTQDQVAAETRLQTALDRQIVARKELLGAKSAEIAALAMQSTSTGKLSAVAETMKQRQSIERELVNLEKTFAKERETVADRQVKIAGMVGEAEQKAAAKRVEAFRTISDVNRQMADVDLRRQVGVLEIRDTRSAVAISGDQNIRRSLAETGDQANKTRTAIEPVANSYTALGKEADKAAGAMGFMRAQGAAILGLFGGPWGVAITAAIVGIGFLAARSAKAAQELKTFSDAYDEAVRLRAGLPKGDALGKDLEIQAGALRKQQDEAKKTEERFNALIDAQKASAEVFRSGDLGTGAPSFQQADQLLLRVGTNAEKLVLEIAKMRNAKEDISPGTEELEKMAKASAQAGAKVKETQEAIARLGIGQMLFTDTSQFDEVLKQYREFNEKAENELELAKLRAKGDEIAADAKKKWFAAIESGSTITEKEFLAAERTAAVYKALAQALKDTTAAREADAEAATAAFAKSLTATADFGNKQLQELQAAQRKFSGNPDDEIRAKAVEKFIDAQKNEINVSFETILAQERKIATINQVGEAYKSLKDAANEAALAELKAARDGAKAFGDFYSELRNKVNNTLLRAKGKDVEARANEIFQEMVNKKPDGTLGVVDYEAAFKIAKAEDAADTLKKSYDKAKSAAEAFTEKLARLKEEAKGAFLGELDREVLKTARSMKAGAEEIAAYVAAAKSGDFSGVSKRLVDVRDLELMKKAGSESREVIKQYGTWAQIAPMAAEEQRKLNLAVENGAITAEQSKLKYANFIAEFGKYQWINKTADALGNFIEEALLDFSKLEDAFKNLLKSLTRIAIQETISNPFKNVLKQLLAGASGGGNIFSMFGSTAAGSTSLAAQDASYINEVAAIKHTGTGSSLYRRIPAAAMIGAPRLHSGLTSGEYAAVLKKGEHVLTADMANRSANLMSAMSARTPVGNVQQVVDIYVENKAGEVVSASASSKPGLGGPQIRVLVDHIKNEVAGDIAHGDSNINRSFTQRYGANRARGNPRR